MATQNDAFAAVLSGLPPEARRDFYALPQPEQDKAITTLMRSYAPAPARPPMAIKPLNDFGSVATRAPQNLGLGFRSGVAGLAHTGSNVARKLDDASTWVADKTGTAKGGAFGDIADTLDHADSAIRPTDEETAAAGNSVGDQVARGAGEAAPQMAGYMGATAATGNPVTGMGLMDAASNLDKGRKEALIAGVKGALMGKVLGATEGMSLPARVGVNAAIPAASTAVAGGDLSNVVSAGIVGGGLAASPNHDGGLREHLSRYPQFVEGMAKHLGNEVMPHLPEIYDLANRITGDPAAVHALTQAALHDPSGHSLAAAALAFGRPDPKLIKRLSTGPDAVLSPEERVSGFIHSDMPWAMVTGTRKAVGDSNHPVNVGSNETLRSELAHLGYKPLEMEGMYQGTSDGTSFFVPGMPYEQAQQLGKKYGQDSVLVGGGGKPAGVLYSESGRLDPAELSKTVYGNKALQKDYYSILHDPQTGSRTPFSLDVAFGTKQKYGPEMPASPTDVTAHSEGQDAYYDHVPGKKWPEWTPDQRESFGQKFGVPGIGNESPAQPIPPHGENAVRLVQYSRNPFTPNAEGGLVAETARHGQGQPGGERRRMQNDPSSYNKNRSYFYAADDQWNPMDREPAIQNQPHKYFGSIGPDKLYDVNAGQEGDPIRAAARAEFEQKGTPFETALENEAVKAGYSGLRNGNTVVMFQDMPVGTSPETVPGAKMVPGGAGGNFTHADMMRLKADPINPENMTQEQRTAVARKQARSTAPQLDTQGKIDPVDLANRWLFALQSPNTPLTQNEIAHSRLKFRSADDIERMASMKDWSSDDIARQFNLQSGDKGGMGLRSSVDYQNIARFADLFKRDPEFFQKLPDESWADHVQRVTSQAKGMSAKVGSFGAVWQDPEHADISAVDRHMATQFLPKMFDSVAERKNWEKGAREQWNSLVDRKRQIDRDLKSGNIDNDQYKDLMEKIPWGLSAKVRSFDQMMDLPGGQAFAAMRVMQQLGSQQMKFRMANGEINPNIPEGLRSAKWIDEPEKVQVISSRYRNALEENAKHAEANGLHLFPSQWSLWDTFRQRLEPHEVMYPDFHKIPKMPEDWTRDADAAHRQAGFKTSRKEDGEDGVRRLHPVRPTDNPGKLAYFSVPMALAAGAAAKAISDRKKGSHPSVKM